MKFVRCIGIVVVLSALTACSGAEKSAGMFLDSAGSVVSSGSDKVFIDPEATPIPKGADKY